MWIFSITVKDILIVTVLSRHIMQFLISVRLDIIIDNENVNIDPYNC